MVKTSAKQNGTEYRFMPYCRNGESIVKVIDENYKVQIPRVMIRKLGMECCDDVKITLQNDKIILERVAI
jgi:hypothetical protein